MADWGFPASIADWATYSAFLAILSPFWPFGPLFSLFWGFFSVFLGECLPIILLNFFGVLRIFFQAVIEVFGP